MKNLKSLFVALIMLLSFNCFSTVDMLSVNHITKKIYVYEEDQYQGVFWDTVAGEQWNKKEKFYLDKGYEYTSYPYVIDYSISILVIFLIMAAVKFFRRR